MVLQQVGIIYCREDGCYKILAVGGEKIVARDAKHSFVHGKKTIKHQGHKTIILSVERDPIDHENVDDCIEFLQGKVDEAELALKKAPKLKDKLAEKVTADALDALDQVQKDAKAELESTHKEK